MPDACASGKVNATRRLAGHVDGGFPSEMEAIAKAERNA